MATSYTIATGWILFDVDLVVDANDDSLHMVYSGDAKGDYTQTYAFSEDGEEWTYETLEPFLYDPQIVLRDNGQPTVIGQCQEDDSFMANERSSNGWLG